MLLPTIDRCVLSLAARNMLGLCGDYSNGEAVDEPGWPAGMKYLANSMNRIGGLFVNSEDVFFYSGTVAELNEFLSDYSKVGPIQKHQIILHAGAGETCSVSRKERHSCDWKLAGCQLASPSKQFVRTAASLEYNLEVHLWTGGRIALTDVVVPENIETITASVDRKETGISI